jgi:hypothetical protein
MRVGQESIQVEEEQKGGRGESQGRKNPEKLCQDAQTSRELRRPVTREVPREEWAGFFEGFSSGYRTWLVTVERLTPDRCSLMKTALRRLVRISAELAERGKSTFSIFLARAPQKCKRLTISEPTRVWLTTNESGADEALEVESANGTALLLRICSPMLPEMVDGILSLDE